MLSPSPLDTLPPSPLDTIDTPRRNARPTPPPTPPRHSPEPNLDELLQRAVERDWAAWGALVSRFEPLVLHAGRRVGLNHADAADVAQLTWLRLLEHAHQIRQPERLPAWLTATARREALRVAVSAKRYILCADPTVENGVDSRGAVNDTYPIDGEYGPEVEQALGRLPTRYQLLLRLLMSDDCLSYTEIARKVNMPIGSIGPMRMRALQMLRRTPEFAHARLPRTTREPCDQRA